MWKHQLPTANGLYWFYLGINNLEQTWPPVLLKITANDKPLEIFAEGGSYYLHSYHFPIIAKRCKYSEIEPPKIWESGSSIIRPCRAWVMDPTGYLGIGFLKPGYHDDVYGSIVWKDHPINGSSHGEILPYSSNYLYCIIPEINY
jgi:hypothetical protein